jgi:hypothetical protein
MASQAERGLAKKLMSQRSSGSVSNDLAASARRVLDGQERSGDMDAIRAHFNVGRSHAGKIRGVTGTAGRFAGTAMNVSRDLEMLSSGSSAAGARALATLGLDVSQEIVRNRRALIKMGEGVATAVGADPALASRFFNSLSRIAKVGGVVGAAVVAGYTAANAYYDTIRAGAEAGKRMTQAFFQSGNRYKALELQDRAQGMVAQESLLTPTTGIGVLDEFFAARQERATSERMDQMLARTKRARELVRPVAGAALARYASRQGKALSDLTAEEINSVMDDEAPKHVGIGNDEYFRYTAQKQAEQVWWERGLMSFSPHYNAAKQHQWSRELNERAMERYATRIEDKARAEQETLRRMTSTDRLQLLHARDEAAANFSAYRSRHRPILLD